MPCVHLDAATLMVHWVHSVLYGGVGKTASASPPFFKKCLNVLHYLKDLHFFGSLAW
jgi:hypothetical protein